MLKHGIVVAFWALLTYRLLGFYSKFIKEPTLPQLDTDQYWGRGPSQPPEIAINRIVFSLEDEKINELKSKLNISKVVFPDPLEGVNFEYGFNSKTLKDVIEYWGTKYLNKWYSEREFYIGKYPLYQTKIQGLNIDYVHVYPKKIPANTKIIPLLLLHGWPGSPLEFYKMIPQLTEVNEQYDFVFEVIIPYLPGFGLSDAPQKQGFDTGAAAIVLNNLMKRIGTPNYYVQGGDFGSMIASAMATLFPQNVFGFHSNFCVVTNSWALIKNIAISKFRQFFIEKEFIDWYPSLWNDFRTTLEENGYFSIHGTKPDTIGAVLVNNPVGLAAYLLEKYSSWTNLSNRNKPNGGFSGGLAYDELLDIVMMYYTTNSAATSVRFYKEFTLRDQAIDNVKTNVPYACARFRNDLRYYPNWILKGKYSNIVQSTYHNEGGHFAAMEVSDKLSRDVFEFVSKVEQVKGTNKEKLEL